MTKQEKRWEAAVAAMQGMITHHGGSYTGTVKNAFDIADAMVEEDEKYKD